MVKTVIISDASSLILLQKILLLDKLVANFQIVISQAVYDEAVKKGKEKRFPDAYKLEEKITNKLIKIKEIKNKKQIKKISDNFNIGIGETESIVLSLEQGKLTVVTDDHKAIAACKIHGIPFLTALTLILVANNHKLTVKEEAEDMIKKLDMYGRYKNKLISEALRKLEEENG